MKKPLKFIDLFAGIGGFHYGFKNAGFSCVMASEIDKEAQNVYTKNHNLSPLGDITKIDPKKIPEHDVLCAGFPCQPFSVCGKKKGFEDTRGTMFFHICSIIKEKQPEVVLLENVKFLIHHDNGNTFKTIIRSLEEMGYHVSYSIQNSIHYGMPQNRERILIVASKNKKFDFNKVPLSIEKENLRNFLDVDNSLMEYLNPSDYTLIENPIIQKISGLKFVGYRNKNIRKNGVRENTMHLSRVHKQPNRIYSIDGTHPTLPSQETSGRFFIHIPEINRVRRLTIRECYRIMGFPESFSISTSKTEAYKQIGNSVCVPMIKVMAEQIKKQLLDNKNNETQNTIKVIIPEQEKLFG